MEDDDEENICELGASTMTNDTSSGTVPLGKLGRVISGGSTATGSGGGGGGGAVDVDEVGSSDEEVEG